MKIICQKKELGEAIYKAEKITGKNLNLPVLKGVLLETKNNVLKVSSTNLDLGIEIEVPAKIEKSGRVVVSGVVLNSFLGNILEEDKLKIELLEGNILIESKSNKTNISTLPNEDFPSIPKISSGRNFEIDGDMFVNGLKSVWFSASHSSMKPELSSVFIYSDDGKITFVATDSFRLSEKKVVLKEDIDFESVLIPVGNIGDIIRVLEGTKGKVDISLSNNQISFKFNKIFLTSRVIDGVFPDYKQIIPKEIKTNIIVLKEELLNSLKVSNIFADKFNQILFKVKKENKKFLIESKNKEKGKNRSLIDATIEGEDIEIGFNYRYIMDAFQSINSDSISFSLGGAGKPMIITGVSDNSFLYIVMPMNR